MAKLFGTFHYYVNVLSNQNNCHLPGRLCSTNRSMTVFVNPKISWIYHYQHHITFSTAVTSVHRFNHTDSIFLEKRPFISCSWSQFIFLIVFIPLYYGTQTNRSAMPFTQDLHVSLTRAWCIHIIYWNLNLFSQLVMVFVKAEICFNVSCVWLTSY
jgi:hypothetical protein